MLLPSWGDGVTAGRGTDNCLLDVKVNGRDMRFQITNLGLNHSFAVYQLLIDFYEV